jgi:hypothetical protein
MTFKGAANRSPSRTARRSFVAIKILSAPTAGVAAQRTSHGPIVDPILDFILNFEQDDSQ